MLSALPDHPFSVPGARTGLSGWQQAIAHQPHADHHASSLPRQDSRTSIPASNPSDQLCSLISATQPAGAAAAAGAGAAPAILALPSSSFSLQSQQQELQPGAVAASSDSSITSDTISQQQLRLLQFAALPTPHLPCRALVPPALRPRAKPTCSDDDWDIGSATGYFSGASSPICFRACIRQ